MGKHRTKQGEKQLATAYTRLLNQMRHEGRHADLVAADAAEERGVLEEHLRRVLRADVCRKPSDTLFEPGAARTRWLRWAKLEFPLGSHVQVRDDGEYRDAYEQRIYCNRLVQLENGPLAEPENSESLEMKGIVDGYVMGHVGELPMVWVRFDRHEWYHADVDTFYEDEITVLRRGPGPKPPNPIDALLASLTRHR